MKYIKDADYDYIINKYHDASKPFDSFNRFIRRDEIFEESSGMAPEQIIDGILENDRAYASLPHPIRKARALEYVLSNTRISCDERDIFPAIHMLDRPLTKTLIHEWKYEVIDDLVPELEARRLQLERDGIVALWLDYDHSVPVWDRLLSLGFVGILRESEQARIAKPRTDEEEAFFEGIRITYEALLSFLDRLTNAAKTEQMRQALIHLRHGAPQSFYEALLLCYLYFIISEHVDSLQVRSLSNFDRLFLPFYQKDLASGISKEQIKQELAYYFLQFASIGNYWNQPVFLGGENADGTTVINELSYLFLEVYDEMGLYCPKIQIKVSDSTPKDLLLHALDMIRRGHNSIVFVSDPTIRRALMRTGIDAEAARLCNITGCYEYSPQGAYVSTMKYLNLLKPLEYALHGGADGVTAKPSGLPCPPPASYESFEALWEEYKRQLLHVIQTARETMDGLEGYLSYINPLSMLSATFPSALETGKDAIGGGGVINDSHLLFGFLADLSDSMAMIQKYVYERQELTLEELVAILDQNFEGSEPFRLKLKADREKYGNNQSRPDTIATSLVKWITEQVCGFPNARGGKWNCGFHVARMSYNQGRKTAATPNGRLLGEELSKNISASMGQNRDGATAAILSATKLDTSSFCGDAALDLGLLPSAVSGKAGLEAMYSLLMTFVRLGGHALHVNVFDAQILRDAQEHPDRYQDLQIRVCGWNVLWNNIKKEEQDGFIRQAEALSSL